MILSFQGWGQTINFAIGSSSPVCKNSNLFVTINAPDNDHNYDFFNVEYSTDGSSGWTAVNSPSGYYASSGTFPSWAAPNILLPTVKSYSYRVIFSNDPN